MIELAFKGQVRIEKLGNQLRLLALAQFPDLVSMFHFINAGVEMVTTWHVLVVQFAASHWFKIVLENSKLMIKIVISTTLSYYKLIP